MNELFFALVSDYGPLVIGLTTFLSCLALPIPASLVMLAGGAFVASGDIALWAAVSAAYGGALIGDQTGFQAGRLGGGWIAARLGRQPARAALLTRARDMVARWGGVGVFFSTWLIAPLGPWVNLTAGIAGMNTLRFTLWDAAGEAIWVTVYISLGYLFSANIDALAAIMGNAVGALTAAAVAAILGVMLWRTAKRPR